MNSRKRCVVCKRFTPKRFHGNHSCYPCHEKCLVRLPSFTTMGTLKACLVCNVRTVQIYQGHPCHSRCVENFHSLFEGEPFRSENCYMCQLETLKACLVCDMRTVQRYRGHPCHGRCVENFHSLCEGKPFRPEKCYLCQLETSSCLSACGHAFHTNCLERYMQNEPEPAVCPTCGITIHHSDLTKMMNLWREKTGKESPYLRECWLKSLRDMRPEKNPYWELE